MRRFLLVLTAMLPLALLTSACEDSLGLADPLLRRDSSVVLVEPTAGSSLPSAFDFASVVAVRPELPGQAGAWDFALRRSGGTLRLIPNPFGTVAQRPLIGRSSESFAALDRAPTARSAYGDTAITLTEGAVYQVRSRYYSLSGVGTCFAYSKMRVKSLDLAAGSAALDVQGNVGCGDDRLELD